MKLRETLCFSLIAAACWYHLLSKSTVCCVACCQAATKTPKIQQGLPSQSFKQCAHYPWWGQAISLGGCPGGSWYPFFFLQGKKRKKPKKKTIQKKQPKKGTTQKKGYHEPPGNPPRLIACPPSRVVGALFEALTRQLLLDFGSFGRSLAAGKAADYGLWEQVVSTSRGD